MSLQAAYQQFLAAHTPAHLADDAAIYYITTTTSVRGAAEVIKHLNSVRNVLKKKKQDVLSAVENKTSLVVEVDTTLEFNSSGSIYLPGMDDNFLADRVVHLTIIHFVSFNVEGKITQIRQSWDQGALLKQVDVIGKSGRNWPIRDSTEQTKLIAQAARIAKEGAAAAAAPGFASNLPVRSRGDSANVRRDPHASLELFSTHEEIANSLPAVVAPYGGVRPRQRDISEILSDEVGNAPPQAVISPYAGRRPQQRDISEILNDDPDAFSAESVVSPYAGRRPNQRSFTDILGDEVEEDDSSNPSESPSKVIAPKAGASKKFQPVRLFDSDESQVENEADSPETKTKAVYRPNPKKYEHFDFADGPDTKTAARADKDIDANRSKNTSHWSFEDVETPHKAQRPNQGQTRHWDMDGETLPETPSAASRKPALRPRQDAESRYEFLDDGKLAACDEEKSTGRLRGVGHNEGLTLYENNLYKEDGSAPTPGADERALENITNLKDRHKNFEPHFSMADVSPAGVAKKVNMGEDRKKVVKMMESNWSDAYENSPLKENNPRQNRGIQTAGDGMGGKKNGTATQTNTNRGIQTAGDGMGGKKTGRGWTLGGNDEDEPIRPIARKQTSTKQTISNKASDFWDF